MGTLTASMPRLPEHCPHKLPTSCRLTSTPLCCACADKRPHSSTYRIYIDGVGFVNRGTRWQNYCWFCKVFWGHRLADTHPSLSASQTRIPEIPDQSAFLRRWWEFHKGYREIRHPNGTMERIPLDRTHQPLKNAAPGQLPEMREEVARELTMSTEYSHGLVHVGGRDPPARSSSIPEEPIRSLEDELEAMIQDASTEDSQDPSTLRSTEPVASASFNDDDNVMAGTLSSAAHDGSRSDIGGRQRRGHLSRHERRQRAQNAHENWARVFGTREEVERLGEEDQSPIDAMYTRAWDRYRAAENERTEREEAGTVQALRDTAVPRESHPVHYDAGVESSSQPRRDRLSVYNPTVTEEHMAVARAILDLSLPRDHPTVTELLGRPRVGLDVDDGRPAAKTDEEMTVKLSCRICYSQVADTAVVPCGHLAMCQWCADQAVPVAPHDKTRPVDSARCPVCRGKVRRRFKVITV